jgi:A/G-specific adenine glycosylase
MHLAARAIVGEHGGQFPREIEQIRNLPGIGRYTAGAIASFAFDARQPILEANTMRLLTRLLAYRGDPRQVTGQALLWKLAEALLPRRGCGELNQALMELGSLICRPRNPRCSECPALALCPTYRAGLQEAIPPLQKTAPAEAAREAAVVVRRRGRVLLLRRGGHGRWAGLWDFPRFALAPDDDGDVSDRLIEGVAAMTGIVSRPVRQLATLKHTVTRFRIILDCHLAEYVSRSVNSHVLPPLAWVTPAGLENYPLSVTGRKLARLVASLK